MDAKGYDTRNTRVYGKTGLQLKHGEVAALLCPECKMVLRDPVQITACGHRFCRNCLDAFTRDSLPTSYNDPPLQCPVDGEEFILAEVRSDKGCQKEIQTLTVDCPTQPNPCDWRGLLVEMEEHIQACPSVEVVCEFHCGARFPQSQKEKHARECQKRCTNCQYCGSVTSADTLQDHYIQCEGFPTTCDYCHKEVSQRKELANHLEDECTEYEMACPLRKLGGCIVKGKRPQMMVHVQECHLIQACETVAEVREEVSQLKTQNQQLHIIVGEQRDTISKLLDRMLRVENFLHSGVEYHDMVEADSATWGRKKSASPKRSLLNLPVGSHSRATPVTNELEKDGGKQSRLIKASVSKLEGDVETQHLQLMQIVEDVQSLQQSTTSHALVLDELRLRQDILDVKTTNGVFVWKIPDIRRRYRDAIDRKTISLYSPPFYTSPHGYRMCIRTYLNGDGIGKGTHISVFFVLMRSEYDELLTWPFKQSVRFTLINQVHPEASISEAFIPDLQSPSFRKPEGDMNVASGFPRFAKQAVLQDENFTKGNTIHIKAQVDLTGLNRH